MYPPLKQESEPMRRTGDAVRIRGDYQHRAITSGRSVQRFWHYIKKLTIAELLPPDARDFAIDVGCGSGVVSSYLGEYGATVLGVDENPSAIEYATRQFANENVSFRSALADGMLATDRPADKIYCLEVIEHVYPRQAVDMLRVFHDLLTPGGRVFLTTPNYRSLWPLIEWGLDRFTSAQDMHGDQHVTHYNPRSLSAACQEAGFRVDRIATVACLAPWIAALSWNLAIRVHRVEIGSWPLVGSIIACTLSKQS